MLGDGRPPSEQVVGRLAPSPTGGLHVGHARTFLLAWLAARSSGGRVVLRIEDIDAARVRPGAAEAALEDLRWLGLDWDRGPYVQSERIERYRSALERLKRMEAVYPCTCTRAEIERAAAAPHPEDEPPAYPGTCSGRSASDPMGDRPFAWRFRVGPEIVEWDDIFRGHLAPDPRRGGDFIVAREPFAPAYQLAVVVDDAAMGVNQVIRGDDLIPSTPRQILLARALEAPGREYGHAPLVVGPHGRRLAKRDGSIKLATLREGGIDPRLIVGWAARSCGWTDRIEPSDPRDWIGRFNPATVPPAPCRFDLGEIS